MNPAGMALVIASSAAGRLKPSNGPAMTPGEAISKVMPDLLEELPLLALLGNPQLAVIDLDLETIAGERADEHDEAGVLANVDKAAGPGQAAAEAADVDVAGGIALSHAKTGHVEAATVVEIELLILVDHRIHVDPGPEVTPGRGNPTDQARFDSHSQ